MSNIIRIPSKLYSALDEKGGAKLIAYYCMVKFYKKGDFKYYSFKSKNNKAVSGASLIRSKTNISLNSIRKYNPMIIEMGLAQFDHKGDFVLKGNNKLNIEFNNKLNAKKAHKNKLVPVLIGSSLVDTSHKLLSVKLMSNYKEQLNMIQKKTLRKEISSHADSPRNRKEARKADYNKKKFGDFIIIDKAVLSVESYARVKDGTLRNKSKGQYWKSVFIKKRLITSSRNFTYIRSMSHKDFLSYKFETGFRNIIYKYGHLAIETASSFKPLDLVLQ